MTSYNDLRSPGLSNTAMSLNDLKGVMTHVCDLDFPETCVYECEIR